MSHFVWAMAWRETRGSLRHFLFFFACITVGVAGLVGVTGFASSLESAIRKEGRKLLAGDLEIRSHRPLSPHGLEMIQALRDRGILATTVFELIAMSSDRERSLTQLVELKAVPAGYPLYGRLVTEPSGAADSLLNTGNVLVEDSLLLRLDLKTGDRIRLGQAEFAIAGILKKEPDRVAGVFSLGPRVMISEEGLAATGLIQPGSRVLYRTLLKMPQTFDIKSTQREI
ncbi:MAG: ABC transporter permease, partial [Nitrospiria bacterium]